MLHSSHRANKATCMTNIKFKSEADEGKNAKERRVRSKIII